VGFLNLIIEEIFSESLASFKTKAFIEKMNSQEDLDGDLSFDDPALDGSKKKKKDDNFDVMIHRQLMLKKQRLQEQRSKSPG
jgi:hypothetical protein